MVVPDETFVMIVIQKVTGDTDLEDEEDIKSDSNLSWNTNIYNMGLCFSCNMQGNQLGGTQDELQSYPWDKPHAYLQMQSGL